MKPAPTKEFFKHHFIDKQEWITTSDCVDYRFEIDGDMLIIAFQQSRDINCYNGRKDWIRNLRAMPKWSGWARSFFHKGFLIGFNNNHSYIYSEIFYNVARKDLKKILITAYSQGCGIGKFEYMRLKQIEKNIEIEQPIFFADPRIIWWPFSFNVAPYLKDALCVRTRKDIVPHLPTAWMGYKHFGKVLYLDEPEGYKHPDNISELVALTHHYPEYYMACLPSEKE